MTVGPTALAMCDETTPPKPWRCQDPNILKRAHFDPKRSQHHSRFGMTQSSLYLETLYVAAMPPVEAADMLMAMALPDRVPDEGRYGQEAKNN